MAEEKKNNVEETVNKLHAEIDEATAKTMAAASEEAKQAVNESKAVYNGLIDDLKAQLAKLPDSKEEWDAAIADFKKGAADLSAKATEKFNSFKNDPETAKAIDGVKAYYANVSDKVVAFCKDNYAKASAAASNNETLKNAGSQIVNKSQDALNFVKAKYDDFTNNPEVQATVVKARDTVVDYANKAVDAIKKAVNPDDNNGGKEE